MTILPGDIVMVEHLMFKNGKIDNSENGRPCLVLYSDSEHATILPLTSKYFKYFYNHDYLIYDFGEKLSLIELMQPYKVDRNSIIYPLRNVGKDFFRIIYHFQLLHLDSNNNEIIECCKKLRAYTDIEGLLKPVLNDRYMQLKEKSRCLREKSEDVEDMLEKRLLKRKNALYKKNKQQLSC